MWELIGGLQVNHIEVQTERRRAASVVYLEVPISTSHRRCVTRIHLTRRIWRQWSAKVHQRGPILGTKHTTSVSTTSKTPDQLPHWPSTPIEETYCSMFSCAVPVQLEPSIWQAFHDGMSRVAERISAMTSELSSSLSSADDPVSPALVVGSCGCAEPPLSSLPLWGGGARLKEPEVSSKTPSDVTQSCQGTSWEMDGETGWNGWYPRTRISWMMNKEGNGTWPSRMSSAIALP